MNNNTEIAINLSDLRAESKEFAALVRLGERRRFMIEVIDPILDELLDLGFPESTDLPPSYPPK
jgi:hypothetical protein